MLELRCCRLGGGCLKCLEGYLGISCRGFQDLKDRVAVKEFKSSY